MGDTRRGLRVGFEEWGERSRRRVRDLVTQLAFEGLSQNEIGRARISMMARSDLLHARAGYRSARPVAATLKIRLAPHGRSIQMGHSRRFDRTSTMSGLPPNNRHSDERWFSSIWPPGADREPTNERHSTMERQQRDRVP